MVTRWNTLGTAGTLLRRIGTLVEHFQACHVANSPSFRHLFITFAPSFHQLNMCSPSFHQLTIFLPTCKQRANSPTFTDLPNFRQFIIFSTHHLFAIILPTRPLLQTCKQKRRFANLLPTCQKFGSSPSFFQLNICTPSARQLAKCSQVRQLFANLPNVQQFAIFDKRSCFFVSSPLFNVFPPASHICRHFLNLQNTYQLNLFIILLPSFTNLLFDQPPLFRNSCT